MKGKVKKAAQENRRDFIKFVIFGVLIVLMVLLTIALLPWIISLKDEAGREALQQYIRSKGVWGVLILLGIQILQVVVAFIPGEPIEVMAGLLYGTVGGWAICTVGMLMGTVMIYYLVRWLGSSFVGRIMDEKKLEKYRFLHDTRRLETMTFLLFFIPGTPKDMLTYFMPFTKIKPAVFFLIVSIARIPSIISSTFAGASIGEGKWIQTILIFVVIGLVGLAGIWCNDLLMKRISAQREKRK